MIFDPPLERATLIKRYKRFLTDVVLKSGEEATIHCPNTGSMRACISEGSDCWFSVSDNPKRKYSRTWEVATTPTGHLAGINSARANNLVVEALEVDLIAELTGYRSLKTEQRYGEERSRIDVLLSAHESDTRDCYVEVKSVTLLDEVDDQLQGFFPDAVSERGTKHLRELASMAQAGQRAVLLFCVQHTGIDSVAPAAHIDKKYSNTLMWAIEQGVEVIAYRTSITPEEIKITESVPVVLDGAY